MLPGGPSGRPRPYTRAVREPKGADRPVIITTITAASFAAIAFLVALAGFLPGAPAPTPAAAEPVPLEMPFAPPNRGVVVPPETPAPQPTPIAAASLGGSAAGLSASGTAQSAPSAPQNHTVLPEAAAVLQTWTAPASDGGKPITGYLVQQADDVNFTQNLFFASVGPTVSFEWTSVTPGNSYFYRVRAANADGFGAQSTTVKVTVPLSGLPAAPASPVVRPLPSSVRATWGAPSSNGGSAVTSYLVRVTGTTGTVVAQQFFSAATFSALLANLTPWSDLFFRVAAVNGSGLGPFTAGSYFVPTNTLTPQCLGSGADGKRVELIYAYGGASPNAELLQAANGYATRIERMLTMSATATGGVRHLRWRTNNGSPGCTIVLNPVQVPTSLQHFSEVVNAVKNAGFNQPDRKYLTWVEDTTIPGYADPCTAQFLTDDSPGQTNLSNTTTLHSVCSLLDGIGFGPGHEIMHNFGAVQSTAPHSDSAAHCTQGFDPMCYGLAMVVDPACADQFVYSYVYDCGGDDYFNTNPAPGSYLCTHWNTARSAFLTNNLDETVPSAPLSLQATAGNGQVSLSWLPPTKQTCTGITSYTVTRSPGSVTTTVGGTSTTISGLTNGTTYTFTVHANAAGGSGPESSPSNPVIPTAAVATAPGPPTSPAAAPGDGQATVSWTPPASNGGSAITGYRLTVSPGGTFVDVAPGTSAVFPGLTNGTSYTFTVQAFNGVGISTPAGPTNAVVLEPQRTFHGLTPLRLVDSRSPPDNVGPFSAKWGPAEARDITVTGVTSNGVTVPGSASAVVLNVTVVNPTAPSFLTIWPSLDGRPTASNLNFVAGQVVPNLVTVKVGAAGKVSIFNNSGFVDVLVDIVGFFDGGDNSGSRFVGVTPTRILDSRPPPENVGPFATAWGAGVTRTLPVRNVGPVPANATAVVVNMTVTGPSAASFLTVFPDDASRPTASNLNFSAGQTIANLVVVPIGAGGGIKIFNNSGSVQVIADVVAYFSPTGTAFTPINPRRIVDSRPAPENIGTIAAPWGVGQTREVVVGLDQGAATGVPADAAGVVLNVTTVNGSAESFLTVWPAGQAQPTASNINFPAGRVVPNLVMVPLGTQGKLAVFNNKGAVDVLVDVVGYYR